MKNLWSESIDPLFSLCYILNMNNEVKDALSDSIRGFRLPRYHELPDVGLYLEQTTKYINQKIGPLGFDMLTGSMIRNYVKQGLVSNPVKKQYSANQIAHLIAIAALKQAIPLEHIGNFFSLQEKFYTDEVAYNYFCEEMENILYYRFGLKSEFDSVGITDTLVKEMLRSAIVAVSHIVYLNACLKVLENKVTNE